MIEFPVPHILVFPVLLLDNRSEIHLHSFDSLSLTQAGFFLPSSFFWVYAAAVMARTIPEGWTQIPGCLPQEDLWGWTVSGRGYLDMLGGPTATSSCYPPDY